MIKRLKQLILYIIILLLVISVLPIVSIAVESPIIITSNDVQGENVTVTGTIDDPVAQQNPVTLIFKNESGVEVGSTVSEIETTNWSITFNNLSDGVYNYTIEANGYEPTPFSFTVDTIAPTISNTTSASFLNIDSFISGTADDGSLPGSKPTIELEIYDSNSTLIYNSIINDPSIVNNKWDWYFPMPESLSDGEYTYKISATDLNNNQTTTQPYSFTFDNKRPTVQSIKITSNNGVIDILKNENLTQVSTDTTIKIKYTDEMYMDLNSTKIKNTITLIHKNDTVELTRFEDINNPERIDDKTVEITYKLSGSTLLLPSTTYYFFVNPDSATTDAAGNKVFPIVNKFTTVSDTVKNTIFNDITSEFENLPHGFYTQNVNTCTNCHGTHTSNSTKLGKASTEYTTSYDSYCMACHDGTVVAPMPGVGTKVPTPEKFNEGVESNHEVGTILEHGSNTGSCTSCHNPHLSWSKDNPNLLKDHFVYEHEDRADYPDGLPIGEIDSQVQQCENCHDKSTTYLKEFAAHLHDDEQKSTIENYPINQGVIDSRDRPCEECHLENINFYKNTADQGVRYLISHYRKTSASGITDDYDLCFRCHDGTKKWIDGNNQEQTISNIKKYYNITTNETDLVNSNLSMHRITANDGSKLLKSTGAGSNDGHIPCAECHDTHGSSNVKILKLQLGHENRQQDFTATDPATDLTDGVLKASKEREFCIKCHDGSTAIYGTTGKDLHTRTGHDPVADINKPCSSCHGTGETALEKALSAAHAPK